MFCNQCSLMAIRPLQYHLYGGNFFFQNVEYAATDTAQLQNRPSAIHQKSRGYGGQVSVRVSLLPTIYTFNPLYITLQYNATLFIPTFSIIQPSLYQPSV